MKAVFFALMAACIMMLGWGFLIGFHIAINYTGDITPTFLECASDLVGKGVDSKLAAKQCFDREGE